MERLSDEAVVLSTVDYGDADRIVTLLTRSHGRVSGFAPGARASRRRFAGAFEAGNHLQVRLVERRGDTLRLDGADIVQSFFRLREDLTRIARCLYCLELCRELTRDREPHDALFCTLLRYLEALERGAAGPTSVLKFELDVLSHTGFRPQFDPCAKCGQAVGARPRFDPDHGGVVCERCAGQLVGAVAVHPSVVSALAAIQLGERTPLSVEVRGRARELLQLFITHHLGRRLRSVSFMEQVGAT